MPVISRKEGLHSQAAGCAIRGPSHKSSLSRGASCECQCVTVLCCCGDQIYDLTHGVKEEAFGVEPTCRCPKTCSVSTGFDFSHTPRLFRVSGRAEIQLVDGRSK